jgi:glyoxylase-like metal-dependent hydrolase (beta-lactamase superfamily II)
MKMHVLSGGRLRMRKNIYFPAAAKEETIDLPVSSFLLRHTQGNVLYDSGCHPSALKTPEARWGNLARLMVPIGAENENVIDGLNELGFQPDDVDVVVCSHFHPDHCGCNEYFKKATLICHTDELAAARTPGSEKQGYLAGDWNHLENVDSIAGERDLFGDGRIVLVPLPGHTPGTTAALVSLEQSGRFLLASDSVSLNVTLDREVIPRNNWNTDLFLKSLSEVRRIRAQGAVVICGHDLDQWQTLKKGADAYV